ncbi:hypothetical protein GCM10023192_08440 [Amycolatopsis samaneae]
MMVTGGRVRAANHPAVSGVHGVREHAGPDVVKAGRGKRKPSEALRGAARAAPSHPVDLTGFGADHVPHPAPAHPAGGRPAATRTAAAGEAQGDGHTGILAHPPAPGHGYSWNRVVSPSPARGVLTRLTGAESQA